MNGDMLNTSSERLVWEAPVLEGLQDVADVLLAPKGKGTDKDFPASS